MTGARATAHDLNNALAKIMGAAELALDCPIPEAARQHLDLIIACVQESVGLVDDLSRRNGG